MSEPHTTDPPRLIDTARMILAYREITRAISKSANGTIVWGGILLALWIMLYARGGMPNWEKVPLYGYAHLAIALAELSVGLLKKFRPSPVSFLLNAGLLFAFGAQFAWRGIDLKLRNGGTDLFSFGLAAYHVWLAYEQFKAWRNVTRALPVHPDAAQLKWFEGLLREIRAADPSEDGTAIRIPSTPPLRGKLLGDMAVFVTPDTDAMVAERDDVELFDLEESSDDGRSPVILSIEGQNYGPFAMDVQSQANFNAWKNERRS